MPTLFVDESGHTGSALFDLEQSVLVYAGVWDREDDAEALSRIEAETVGRSGVKEVKGAQLSRTPLGRRGLAEYVSGLGTAGVPVVAIALNKPFMVAGVVIEDGLDPMDNPIVSQSWYNDPRQKEVAAQLVYQSVPADVLNRWWEGRSASSGPSPFREAHAALVGALRQSTAGVAIADALLHLDVDTLHEDTASARGGETGYAHSDLNPTVVCFCQLLREADLQAEALDYTAGHVIHDHQRGYESALRFHFDLLRDGIGPDAGLPNGNVQRGRLQRLNQLTFASGRTGHLPSSDRLASAIRIVVEDELGHSHSAADALREALRSLGRQTPLRYRPFYIGPVNEQESVLHAMLGGRPHRGG